MWWGLRGVCEREWEGKVGGWGGFGGRGVGFVLMIQIYTSTYSAHICSMGVS